MSHHRFAEFANRISFSAPRTAVPPTVTSPPALIACPAVFLQTAAPPTVQWMQAIYREAFEQACRAMKPSWLRLDRFWEFN